MQIDEIFFLASAEQKRAYRAACAVEEFDRQLEKVDAAIARAETATRPQAQNFIYTYRKGSKPAGGYPATRPDLTIVKRGTGNVWKVTGNGLQGIYGCMRSMDARGCRPGADRIVQRILARRYRDLRVRQVSRETADQQRRRELTETWAGDGGIEAELEKLKRIEPDWPPKPLRRIA